MDFVKGYKPVSYPELKKELNKALETSGKKYPELAVAAELNSTQSISFVFDADEQKVSDKVLTSVLTAVNLGGFVMWIGGEKHYFIKTKN